jgi:phosphate transport system permease protein
MPEVTTSQGSTTLGFRPDPDEPEIRSRVALRKIRPSDVFALAGAAAASLALTALVFTTMTPFDGSVGFVVVWFLLFVGTYALLTIFDETAQAVRDRIAGVVIRSLAAIVVGVLVFVIAFTFGKGWEVLLNANFFSQDMSNAGPLDPLIVGGIIHAVVGTLIEIAIALAIVIPLGVTVAVFLTEMPGKFSRIVRTIVEAMTALPSIVAGLFIYATLIMIFTKQQSGFAAAMAISIMMLPIIIRSADVALRLVPGTLKEASFALGSSQWSTVRYVTLPTAKSGLATAIILGTARGIGETSPVLLCAGFTAALNWNPFSGPMISLPLATFEFVKSPEPTMIARGFGTALVLLFLVLIMFVVARYFGGKGPGHLSKGQMKKRQRVSDRDMDRIKARMNVGVMDSFATGEVD